MGTITLGNTYTKAIPWDKNQELYLYFVCLEIVESWCVCSISHLLVAVRHHLHAGQVGAGDRPWQAAGERGGARLPQQSHQPNPGNDIHVKLSVTCLNVQYIVISKDVRNGFKNLILCRDIPTHER